MPRLLTEGRGNAHMNNEDSRPVRVTAEEHQHPALRILARACLAIAREQLEREGRNEHHSGNRKPGEAPEPKPGDAKEGEA